ncbi:hypothetical protein VTL71DRAFT_7536 [Oculimacula yallundae]|uniref:Uncharacterized protein n=1 Tax=Oculimacula yallundae TaxID=86028 RepID=A0ABR4BUH2_9HELO
MSNAYDKNVIDGYIGHIVRELDQKMHANFERALRLVKSGDHLARVAEVTDGLMLRTMHNADDEVHTLGCWIHNEDHAKSILTGIKACMSQEVIVFGIGLREIALNGRARHPYIPKPGFNEFRPVVHTYEGCRLQGCNQEHFKTPYQIWKGNSGEESKQYWEKQRVEQMAKYGW